MRNTGYYCTAQRGRCSSENKRDEPHRACCHTLFRFVQKASKPRGKRVGSPKSKPERGPHSTDPSTACPRRKRKGREIPGAIGILPAHLVFLQRKAMGLPCSKGMTLRGPGIHENEFLACPPKRPEAIRTVPRIVPSSFKQPFPANHISGIHVISPHLSHSPPAPLLHCREECAPEKRGEFLRLTWLDVALREAYERFKNARWGFVLFSSAIVPTCFPACCPVCPRAREPLYCCRCCRCRIRLFLELARLLGEH